MISRTRLQATKLSRLDLSVHSVKILQCHCVYKKLKFIYRKKIKHIKTNKVNLGPTSRYMYPQKSLFLIACKIVTSRNSLYIYEGLPTKKFEEFKQRARTGCRMLFSR